MTGPGGRGGRSRAFVPGRPLAIPSRHPVPDLFSATRVLAIQPHYDDNDIAAGGTIAALIDAGIEVVYCTVTDDLVGVVDVDGVVRNATLEIVKGGKGGYIVRDGTWEV